MISQKPLKVTIIKIKMQIGSRAVSLFLALGESFIHHPLAFSPFPAQIGNLQPLRTNEKTKGIVTITAMAPGGLTWENLRGKGSYRKQKRNLPGIKLCYLEPPSHDFKATFP